MLVVQVVAVFLAGIEWPRPVVTVGGRLSRQELRVNVRHVGIWVSLPFALGGIVAEIAGVVFRRSLSMLANDRRQAWSDHAETTMPTLHPVRALCATLEATRLRAVEALAAESAPSPDALRELATLQAAVTAVRELIEEHGVRLGWSGDDELDKAALGLARRK